jgi:amino acid transporter
MSEASRRPDEGLVRAIGPVALGINVVNLTVGAGIFVLPGVVAALLGPAAVLAYLACSVAVALIFLCFAEIGSRVTRSGGAYAYIEDAFGPFAGFVASALLWFGWNVLADAALVVALADTVAAALPWLAAPVPRAAFIAALCAGLAWVNIIGVRSGVRVLVFNTVAKLVPLALVIVAGVFAVQIPNLAITEWPTFRQLGAAALVLFFAFAGAESGLHASGEIRDPEKTVPRGLALGLGGILLLYLGLQTVAQGVLGPELAQNTGAPLAAVARAVLGEWGAGMLLAAGAVSIFATLSGDILATPRVVFASARDGHLPAWLAGVHPRYRTPSRAIAFFAAAIAGLAITGTFKPLAVVASGSILLVYLGVSLAVIRLRRRDGPPPAGAFRLPGGIAVPVLSCAVAVWFLWQLTAQEATGLVALLAAATIVAVVRRRR